MAAPIDNTVKIQDVLPRVFSFLCSGACKIADDACLHKLRDVVTKYVASSTSVKESGLEKFLEDVSKNASSIDSAVLTFCVELAGWLGSSEDLFQPFIGVIQPLIVSVRTNPSLAEDVSVKTATYKTLAQIVQHQHGAQWVLYSHSDFIENVWQVLECGLGLFLEKSVLQFLTQCWASVDQRMKADTQNKFPVEWFHKNIITSLRTAVEKSKQQSISQTSVAPVIKLLNVAISHSEELAEPLFSETEFVHLIHELVQLSKGHSVDFVINVLVAVGKSKNSGGGDEIWPLIQKLFQKGLIKNAQKLAVAFLLEVSTTAEMTIPLCHVILSPVHVLLAGDTEQDVYLKDRTVSCSLDVLKTMMSNKLKCVDAVSHTLLCVIKTKQSVISEVSQVLKSTCTDGWSQSTTDIRTHLGDNSRIQRLCMEYFLQEHGNISWEKAQEFVSSVINIMKKTSADSVNYSLCADCLLPWMTHICQTKNMADTSNVTLATELGRIIQHHLCALHWEIRDTTLEFLAKLLQTHTDSYPVTVWVRSHKLHVSMYQCIRDGESYVRASAITCCSFCLHNSELWEDLLTQQELEEALLSSNLCGKHPAVEQWGLLTLVRCFQQGNFVMEIVNILRTDTEAFARRAAARFLHGYYDKTFKDTSEVSNKTELAAKLTETMTLALTDFDWEVKLEVLNFWEDVVSSKLQIVPVEKKTDMPAYAKCLFGNGMGVLQNCSKDSEIRNCLEGVWHLDKIGCWKALISAVDDFDLKVCEKACIFLHNVKLHLEGKIRNLDEQHLEIMCQQCSDTMINNIECEDSSGSLVKKLKLDREQNQQSKVLPHMTQTLFSLVSDLVLFDITKYTQSFCSQTDYSTNPLSLLEDILSYQQKDDEEDVVDCY